MGTLGTLQDAGRLDEQGAGPQCALAAVWFGFNFLSFLSVWLILEPGDLTKVSFIIGKGRIFLF